MSANSQYTIDDAPTGKKTFADLGITPSTLEEQIAKYTRLYRPAAHAHDAFDDILRKRRWIAEN